ncbi:glycosyltransferase [Aeromicrobium sp. UC242_57]|uniref:glycosyltransferase n=1 Tax=Aeromicrobium sp. UC242_57 TaxID=3374624 RepID=UPI0037B90561
MLPEVTQVCVVVPARDEQDLLPSALRALDAARDRVRHIRVDITVVADRCTDQTAELAASHGAIVISTDAGNVGAARAAGCSAALARHANGRERLWLATTDADSQVPSDWIQAQLATAAEGHDLFLGTVRLARTDQAEFGDWVSRYAADARRWVHHGHVHGASLGIRAETYVDLGGFRPLDSGEDVDLIHRASKADAVIAWEHPGTVTTSARRTGRAPGGVAADLASPA